MSNEKAETSSAADNGIVRGPRGRFVKTAGKPRGVKHKEPRMTKVSRPKAYADIAAEVLSRASEAHLEAIVANVTEQGKTDATIGLAFAKLCAPAVQRRFIPAGAERLTEVPFVDRPEIVIRLAAERVLDIDSAKFFLDAHKLQMELGFTKTLRLALDKYQRGDLDMQGMLTALGDALLQHETTTFEGEGEGDDE